MKGYHFKSIQLKMLTAIVIFLVIPIFIIAYRYTKTTENIIQEEIKKENSRELVQLRDTIEGKMSRMVKAANYFATSKQVKEVLFNGEKDDSLSEWELSQHYYRNYLLIDDIIQVAQRTILADFDNSITLFDFHDNNYTSQPKRSADKDESWRRDQWFNDVASQKGYISWIFHQDNVSKNYFITLARLLNTGVDDKWRGIITISYNEKEFFDGLLRGQQAENVFIIDELGNVVSNTNRELIGTNLSQTTYVQSILGDGNEHFIESIENQEKFISYTKSELTGWYIIKIRDYDTLFNQLIILRTRNIILITLVILGLILITYIIIFSITLPIKKLMTSMRDVEKGKFDLSIEVKGQDEVAQLGKRFNRMVQKINQLIFDIQEKQKKEEELRLQVLYAQINPHFLFNTLNTIKWIALVSQAKNVAKLIAALGRLLEMSIKNMDEYITIKDEIENLESYLSLQKARYNQSYKAVIDVSPEVEQLLVPKLILQPIVENALIHGWDRENDDQIVIEVSGVIKDGKLSFIVRDNGLGISPERLTSILNSIDSNESKGRFSGIGLNNVHQRIQLMFGKEYGVEINSDEGVGTTIYICLPIQEGIENDKNTDC